MANARIAAPICGAARPTVAGPARIVSTRSTATARCSPPTAPEGRVGVFSAGWG
jgi:hypothetical protein